MEIVDSPVEKYLNRIDDATRDGFSKVKKEMRELQTKTDKLDSALKLQEEIKDLRKRCDSFVQDSKFTKEIERLSSNDAAATKAIKLVDEVEKLKTELKKVKSVDEFEAKISEIYALLSTLEVKKIDVAKLDTQIAKIRKELESITDRDKKLEIMNQDFVEFRKSALTTYKFSKLQSHIDEIDKDVKKLVGLHEYVRNLSNKDDIKELKKSFDAHSGATNRLAIAFEKSANLHSRIKQNNEDNSRVLGMIRTNYKNQDLLAKRMSNLEKALEKVNSSGASMKNISFKRIVLKDPEKENKRKVVRSGKTSDDFYNWLVTDSKKKE